MDEKPQGKQHSVEVQVCPRCLSTKVARLSASGGDMTGALALLPPKYTCAECGWIGRLIIMRDVDLSNDLVDGEAERTRSNSP